VRENGRSANAERPAPARSTPQAMTRDIMSVLASAAGRRLQKLSCPSLMVRPTLMMGFSRTINSNRAKL
jgi:hypothetical protein